jgi:ketosteroid isomerase-like protein
MDHISVDQVKAEVHRFWKIFSSKSKSEMEDLYVPNANVFASDARRIEPGRLTVARRMREYFGPLTQVRAEVGPIEVQMVNEEVAIACYTFHFQATKILPDGSRNDEDVPCGRATHVFQRDKSGVLRIFHEHISSAKPWRDYEPLKVTAVAVEPRMETVPATVGAKNVK